MGSSKFFVDANVLLRYILKDDQQLYEKSKEIFQTIAEKEIPVSVTTLMLHEVIYVLEKLYKVARVNVAKEVKQFIKIDYVSVLDLGKDLVFKALKDYEDTKVDFPDCVYKQIVLQNNLKLLSFDNDFKKIKLARYETI